MNRKKITALLLSSVMAFTPAMPAMAEQSTIIDYVDGTTDSTVETPDVTRHHFRRRRKDGKLLMELNIIM